MNIAVDLGGTNVRVGLVEGNRIVRLLSQPCHAKGPEEEVTGQIFSMIEELLPGSPVKGIGVGVPSVVDMDKGIVYDVIGIPSWKEVHLKELLEARFSLPAYINNDCNCFALGVSRFGEAKGYREAVCVTLGTGVGSSLVIDGRLYAGHNTGAGEIGNIPYLDKDYEFYCSSRFFVSKGTSGKDAEKDAAAGKPDAVRLMDEFGVNIGRLVKVIMYAFDPHVIVFGGSIANAFDLFKSSMWSELSTFPYGESLRHLRIFRSMTPDIGLLGAGSLCD
ncbi:MAG: ROK family protein [Bacteroidetes bacterium]|uniref:ROK family protein n=1 Tax=Candidatus Cryptobacteroides excrementavium TaxID=2840759 RepID=A0A9D9NS85_9BACT|nr:ROK family protein [Candidatus Cryptobacteroides excrementavium]